MSQNEGEHWNAFLKKIESSLEIDPQELVSEDPVEKLWKLIETRLAKDEKSSRTTDAEVQVDIQVRVLIIQLDYEFLHIFLFRINLEVPFKISVKSRITSSSC